MKQVHGSRKATKFALDDVFSSMPDGVITNILNRLPLQDTVRTSTLSRNWRDKWTTMNQLVFDEAFYLYLQKKGNEKDYGNIISRLLFLLKGDITKFDLYLEKGCNSNNWVLDLSKKGIMEFSLSNMNETPIKLTAHLFSCLKLKHLELHNCHFGPMSTFHGFPNLLSLDFSEVVFGSYTCGQFLSRCPLLQILKLRDNTISEINRADIAKLENLKVLVLPLYELDNMAMMTTFDIFQLIGYFPKLQELNLDFWDCTVLADAVKRIPTALPWLKTLRLYEIDFNNVIMVSCVVDLICGFPNLKTLLIKATYEDDVPTHAVSSLKVDFSKMGKLHLQKVKFVFVRYINNEMCLMKSLLACSPSLKKMVINPKISKVFDGNEGKRKFVTELMLHRASPITEIIID